MISQAFVNAEFVLPSVSDGSSWQFVALSFKDERILKSSYPSSEAHLPNLLPRQKKPDFLQCLGQSSDFVFMVK